MPSTRPAPPYAITVSGHDLFLFAHDWPYFRLPRERWAESLQRLLDADLNAVVLSVPWGWHEPEEGELDLHGEGDPRRDLQAALDLCAEVGLYAVVRLGPHIGDVWPNAGLPGWLLDTHPELLALDAQGQPAGLEAGGPSVSYVHPTYQAYVAGWYHACLPLLRRSLITEQGTVVAVEVDHCPSYRGLLEGSPLLVDYNPWVIGQNGRPGLYQRWLAARYGDVAHLNRCYGSHHEALLAVQPPRRPPASPEELPWFRDWRRCKLDLLNQHLEFLYDWLRAGGIDVPLMVVYPYRSPLAARSCADYFRLRGKPLLVAQDAGSLPPAPLGLEAVVQAAGRAELARRWVKGTPLPPAGLDAPCPALAGGHPGHAEALCALQLGHGLNALGLAAAPGATACAEVAPAGPGPHAAISRLGRFLKLHGERLLRTEPLADLALGWYEPYEDCGHHGNTRAYGWRDDYRAMLRDRFGLAGNGQRPGRIGLLNLLALTGLSFAMLDLERDPLDEWLQHPQLWVLGLDFMAASVQRELISYVRAGGHLVMLPRVPYLDERLHPCTLLDQLFPCRPIALPPRSPAADGRTPQHTVVLCTGGQVSVAGEVDTFELLPESEALAWAGEESRPCAYRTAHGAGTATLLGFSLAAQPADAAAHQRFLASLAAQARVRRHTRCDDGALYAVERATPPGAPHPAGYLFVVNPADRPAQARLTCTRPASGAEMQVPCLAEGVEFAGAGALILCLEAPIPGTGLTIAHSTSQVQGWKVEEGGITLSLFGHAHTTGELALRALPGRQPPATDAGPWQHLRTGADDLWVLLYKHQAGETLLHLRA